jgi:hypothetical protein
VICYQFEDPPQIITAKCPIFIVLEYRFIPWWERGVVVLLHRFGLAQDVMGLGCLLAIECYLLAICERDFQGFDIVHTLAPLNSENMT